MCVCVCICVCLTCKINDSTILFFSFKYAEDVVGIATRNTKMQKKTKGKGKLHRRESKLKIKRIFLDKSNTLNLF